MTFRRNRQHIQCHLNLDLEIIVENGQYDIFLRESVAPLCDIDILHPVAVLPTPDPVLTYVHSLTHITCIALTLPSKLECTHVGTASCYAELLLLRVPARAGH